MCWSNTTILSLPEEFIVLLSSFSGSYVFSSKVESPYPAVVPRNGISRFPAFLSNINKALLIFNLYLVSNGGVMVHHHWIMPVSTY